MRGSKSAAALRAEAEKIRRAAAVPTSGGHGERMLMIAVAERMQRDAASLERKADELEAAERLFERKP